MVFFNIKYSTLISQPKIYVIENHWKIIKSIAKTYPDCNKREDFILRSLYETDLMLFI